MKKKIFLLCTIVSQSLFAGEIMYATAVKNVSTSVDSPINGRILPTSKVEILEKVGDKIKVQIEGFVKNGRENAVYFVPKKRILVAALKKGGGYKLKSISQDGDWKKVSFTAYTKNDKLTKDLPTLNKEAHKLFSENCGLCHALHPTTEFTANQWPSMIKAMKSRTPLTKDQVFLVTQYLQKHAKDIKGE